MSVDFTIRTFERHKRAGVDAWHAGEHAAARRHFLQAAKLLYRAASASDGALRRSRVEGARRLVELARSLGSDRPPRPADDGPGGDAETGTGGSGSGGGGGGSKERVAVGDAGPEGGPPPGSRERLAEQDAGADAPFDRAERPSVTFADVAGLEHVKEQIRLRVIYPFSHPDLADRYGRSAGGGVLLYGPPGTGKTLLARATAGEIDAAFFTVKPSEIMNKWVGESEKNIERLFETARSHPVSVIFIDEVESLVPRRRDQQSSVMTRVVPQVLAEMEGFGTSEGNPLLFLGATNEPWSLDPAVLRPGRFDERIHVGLPDRDAREAILRLHLEGLPLGGEGDDALDDAALAALADRLEGWSGADLRNLCRKASERPFLEAVRSGDARAVTLADVEAVLADLRPSVDPDDAARYAAWGDAS